MQNVSYLAKKYRIAIDKALEAREFDRDITFCRFPHGCCGDASDLLAQYLLFNGIKTYYVVGNHYFDDPEEGTQSHAWLLTEDDTIIDITGDQFVNNSTFLNYNVPVYIGLMDEFHELFVVKERDVHENKGLEALGSGCLLRLHNLYCTINKYID
jgi:hypothetical protein